MMMVLRLQTLMVKKESTIQNGLPNGVIDKHSPTAATTCIADLSMDIIGNVINHRTADTTEPPLRRENH
jgi:hypothetical protein